MRCCRLWPAGPGGHAPGPARLCISLVSPSLGRAGGGTGVYGRPEGRGGGRRGEGWCRRWRLWPGWSRQLCLQPTRSASRKYRPRQATAAHRSARPYIPPVGGPYVARHLHTCVVLCATRRGPPGSRLRPRPPTHPPAIRHPPTRPHRHPHAHTTAHTPTPAPKTTCVRLKIIPRTWQPGRAPPGLRRVATESGAVRVAFSSRRPTPGRAVFLLEEPAGRQAGRQGQQCGADRGRERKRRREKERAREQPLTIDSSSGRRRRRWGRCLHTSR